MQKQKFKGTILNTRTAVKNIVEIYNQAIAENNGTNWYNDAHTFAANLAVKHNLTTSKVCGIIAALSPLKSWEENKRIAKAFLIGRRKSLHTNVMLKKAIAILEGTGEVEEICSILNGNKITSFYLNMLFPDQNNNVTIDRHALAVILGRNIKDNEANITSNQYTFFENCYRIAAVKLNVSPMRVQSATWEQWRINKNAAKFEEVPF